MCRELCIDFAIRNLKLHELINKKILDIGSRNVNGTLKHYIVKGGCEYIGIDIENGNDVDIICDAENIIERFGKESFDIVISTETLEHIKNWKKVISNIKNVCKPNGIILITVPSKGFVKHGFPDDYWRYEIDDMKYIFSDCEIIALEKAKETDEPGVCIKAIKLICFKENDLSNYELKAVED